MVLKSKPKAPTKYLVRDRKTGEWYDPQVRFKELLEKPEFVETMKRMKDK